VKKFGIEIEFLSPISADELSKKLNIEYIDDEELIHQTNAFWKLVPDNSIAPKEGQVGLELVSPILSKLDDLPSILDQLNGLGCVVNKTCGLHIHIDITEARNQNDWRSIYQLIERTSKIEPKIYQICPAFRRLGNPGSKNCRPIGIHYHPYFHKPRTTTSAQREELVKNCLDRKQHAVWAPREDKFNRKVSGTIVPLRTYYAGLNFLRIWDFGTVEFRYATSTLEFDIINKWLNLYMSIMDNKNMEDKYNDLVSLIDVEDEETYRPLPSNLTIKKSEIEGLGLFCEEDISNKHVFGVSHVVQTGKKVFKQGVMRTPLGGFINHSEEPNCRIIKQDVKLYKLVSVRDIKAGEELTVYYHMYAVD